LIAQTGAKRTIGAVGALRPGPPEELILAVAARCGIRTFVETGTYHGRTARWAADHFECVVTIERSRPLYERAVSAGRDAENIEFVLGDSRTVLPAVVRDLTGPAVFWLDGHWSGDDTAGSEDECPLLGEVEAIHTSGSVHALFVDDARLFAVPPPPPHDPDQWPALDEVMIALQVPVRRYYVAMVDDVIVAVPPEARREVVSYAQRAVARRRLGRHRHL
jgi:hypothetical protein